MKFSEVMSRDPLLLSPAHTIREVAGMFLARRIDGAPVVDERGELLGLFTKSHIMRAMHEGIDPLTPVADLMTRDHLVTVSPEDTVEEFLQMMMDVPAVDADNPFHMLVAQDYPASRPVGRVPVVEEGRVVGMATRSDLARAFLDLLNSVSNELETIVNSVHNPIISIDRSGDIRLFNRAAERLLGRKMETVMGKNVKAFFPTTRLLETLRTGVAEYSQGIEIDGKHFLSNRSPMIRDGQIIGAVAVLQDVTELEAVYRQLQQSNRINTELDAIIESSFDGLFVTDAHAVVLRMNKAFERIYGFDRQELLGRNMYDLVQEGYFSESVSLLVLQRQEPVTIVQQNIRGKTTLVTGNPVYNEDGEIFRVVTNVRDISELNELKHKLEQAQSLSDHYATQLQQLRMKLLEEQRMIVNSAKMEHLLQMALRLARVDTTVLILGESGVGKELIAETIHNNSDRRDQAFIRINCAAIPETLLESELFGYEGGAFTGARKEGKAGIFELADGGTLFLDEIGELPLPLQAKLLRVLQDREITRVGGSRPIPVDVRIVTGTNRDLAEMVKKKAFREDLYYRLNVVPLSVPPLRERLEEVPALLAHFLHKFNQRYKLNKRLSAEVVDRLCTYSWPGNVRELENLVERMVVISAGDTITCDDLPVNLGGTRSPSAMEVAVTDIIPLREAIENVERQLLEKAFARFRSTRRVAQELGVNQSTVVRKAAKYGIQ